MVDISQRPEEMFRANLRTRKGAFEQLCNDLAPYIKKKDTNYRKAIPVKMRVAITLWRLATNVDYRTLRHLFGVGISTAFSIVTECCRVMEQHLKKKYVHFPKGVEFLEVIHGFQRVWGFAHCAGLIDGRHIPIMAPMEDHGDYFNRKGCHSIIIQAVVDHDHRYIFLDVRIGWPDSVHDARVFVNSRLYRKCEEGMSAY